MAAIRVGTSGYSYQDWRGLFYPKSMEPSEFLTHYAQFFDCVEIDSTYYRIPSPSMMEALTNKVPRNFMFTVKTPGTFTHERKEFLNTLEPFRAATKPMLRKGMLACCLAQFPSSFRFKKENLQHVKAIAGNLDAPVCVEFRHTEWQNKDVYEFLKENEIGFVNVDLPRFRSLPLPSSIATSEIGYIRFHGRNIAKWWQHEEAHERYDYSYSIRELDEWVPRVKEIDEETKELYVMFNNHWRKQSADAAVEMKRLLGIKAPQREKGGDLTDYLS